MGIESERRWSQHEVIVRRLENNVPPSERVATEILDMLYDGSKIASITYIPPVALLVTRIKLVDLPPAVNESSQSFTLRVVGWFGRGLRGLAYMTEIGPYWDMLHS